MQNEKLGAVLGQKQLNFLRVLVKSALKMDIYELCPKSLRNRKF